MFQATVLVILAAVLTCSISARSALAQSVPSGRYEVFAGSELENYLRDLQVIGDAARYPWSVRPFSSRQVDHLLSHATVHPWSSHFDLASRNPRSVEWEIIAPSASLRFNSSFPYGSNDGPIWAGKGVTAAVQAGFFLRAGPLSLIVAPLVFRAENNSFPLFQAGVRCPPTCGNVRFADAIDLPQRFGNRAYQRLDPGQSTLRLDALGLAVGATTADEAWGPAQEYPFLVGNNAAGFPHVFVATGHPVNLLLGHLQARVIYGRLDQSDYSPVTGSARYFSITEAGRTRFASGLAVAFEPGALPGLELGAGRFFHSIWPPNGIPRSYLSKPFEGFTKKGLTSISGFPDAQGGTDNQLISTFFRWVFPKSGVEINGEYGREDHAYDFRDLVMEPDHSRAYSLGFRKIFRESPTAFRSIRAELMNFQMPTLERLGRGEGGTYVHGFLKQGHTERGQLLGADVGVGTGAASILAIDNYDQRGRFTLLWERKVRQEEGNFFYNGTRNPRASDVSHALGVERLRFGRRADWSESVRLIREFNRDFQRDVWNLNLSFGAALRHRKN